MTLSLPRKFDSHALNRHNAITVSQIALNPDYGKIINCIDKEAKTVKRISQETGISISTTYRRIRKLNENKMLILSGMINSENKREFRYRSNKRKIGIKFYDLGDNWK